jgi:hypothetical protein
MSLIAARSGLALGLVSIAMSVAVSMRVRSDLVVRDALAVPPRQLGAWGLKLFNRSGEQVSLSRFLGRAVLVFTSNSSIAGQHAEDFAALARRERFELLELNDRSASDHSPPSFPVASFSSFGFARIVIDERKKGLLPVFDGSDRWQVWGAIPDPLSPTQMGEAVHRLLNDQSLKK